MSSSWKRKGNHIPGQTVLHLTYGGIILFKLLFLFGEVLQFLLRVSTEEMKKKERQKPSFLHRDHMRHSCVSWHLVGHFEWTFMAEKIFHLLWGKVACIHKGVSENIKPVFKIFVLSECLHLLNSLHHWSKSWWLRIRNAGKLLSHHLPKPSLPNAVWGPCKFLGIHVRPYIHFIYPVLLTVTRKSG